MTEQDSLESEHSKFINDLNLIIKLGTFPHLKQIIKKTFFLFLFHTLEY